MQTPQHLDPAAPETPAVAGAAQAASFSIRTTETKTREEKWSPVDLYCPFCAQHPVWKEEQEADIRRIYLEALHLCLACDSGFYVSQKLIERARGGLIAQRLEALHAQGEIVRREPPHRARSRPKVGRGRPSAPSRRKASIIRRRERR